MENANLTDHRLLVSIAAEAPLTIGRWQLLEDWLRIEIQRQKPIKVLNNLQSELLVGQWLGKHAERALNIRFGKQLEHYLKPHTNQLLTQFCAERGLMTQRQALLSLSKISSSPASIFLSHKDDLTLNRLTALAFKISVANQPVSISMARAATLITEGKITEKPLVFVHQDQNYLLRFCAQLAAQAGLNYKRKSQHLINLISKLWFFIDNHRASSSIWSSILLSPALPNWRHEQVLRGELVLQLPPYAVDAAYLVALLRKQRETASHSYRYLQNFQRWQDSWRKESTPNQKYSPHSFFVRGLSLLNSFDIPHACAKTAANVADWQHCINLQANLQTLNELVKLTVAQLRHLLLAEAQNNFCIQLINQHGAQIYLCTTSPMPFLPSYQLDEQQTNALASIQDLSQNTHKSVAQASQHQRITAPDSATKLSLEEFSDAPVQPDLSRTYRYTLIEDQHNCPFRCMASHQLRLRGQSTAWIFAQSRGSALHRAIEELYTPLVSLAPAERLQKLQQALDEATVTLKNPLRIRGLWSKLRPLYAGMPLLVWERDQRWIMTALNELASIEELHATEADVAHSHCDQSEIVASPMATKTEQAKQAVRDSLPNIIIALEKELEVNLYGVRFKLRIDRIDKLASPANREHYVVIDYKSGRSQPLSVIPQALNRVLANIQLHFYAEALKASYGADYVDVAYIHPLRSDYRSLVFRPAESEQQYQLFKGSGHRVRRIKKTSTADYSLEWQHEFQKQIEAFVKGDIVRQPVHKRLCNTCDFKYLCRINENL